MATPQPIAEAGLALEYQDDGTRLIVRDANPEACGIRNRGGEALSQLLRANRQIKALDMRESGISDNGVGHICLALRQTDQLEEFALSPVGLAGLEFLMGVVRRCNRLSSLSATVVDTPTLVAAAQNVTAADYDVSAYTGPPKGEDEEEEAEPAGDDEDEDPQERERKKLEKLRKILNENDYDSSDEASKSDSAAATAKSGASAALAQRLGELVGAVRKKQNLTSVQCAGEAVPEDVTRELSRAVADHVAREEGRARAREERGARTAHEALKDQMEELRASAEAGGNGISADGLLPGEDGAADAATRLGMRRFVGRRLFAALGEALFECQRFKSKQNEAVATPEGESAFLAMYIRKLAEEESAQSAP